MLQDQLAGLRELHPHGRQVLFLKDMFVAQLLAFFNPALSSLRTLEDFSQTRLAQQFLSVPKIARSTFSDAQRLVEPRLLDPIVERLLAEARRRQVALPDLPASLQHVLAVDGSFFRLAAEMTWAIARGNNNGHSSTCARLDLHLNVATWIPEVFAVAGAGVSEAAHAKASITPGAIHLYDRGFFDFELIKAHQQQAFFVMRMREPGERSPRFHAEETRPTSSRDQAAGILSDTLGRLAGSQHRRPPDMVLREVLVTAPDEPGSVVRLLTNLFDLDAAVISQLYRWRWQIELFFRWLKVYARFSRPLSTSPAGVQLNFYVAVIGVLLTCLHSGARPSRYAFSLLALAATGGVTLEEIAPILAERERRSALDRESAARRAVRRQPG